MPGPWDGPVRVIERTPTAFRLATLDGHLEAGQIRFSAEEGDDRLTFAIESWARAGDRLSNLLYDNLRMSKEVQFHMWTSFLEGVIELSEGQRAEGLRIHTKRVEDLPPEELEALRVLRDKPLNFDLAERPSFTRGAGWHIDDYRQPLPSEAPGPPEPDGVWERAKQLMLDYEFADPRIVTAIYAEDSELEGRDMLLEARFWNLIRFRFGVRVGGVLDETRTLGSARGAYLGLELSHPPGPPGDGPDGLSGVEVGRQRRGGVPHTCRLAAGQHPEPDRPAGVSPVRTPGAGPLRSPGLSADGLPAGR